MKKIILLLILSPFAFAVEGVNFTGRFGTANISSDDATSSGFGLSLESEIYLTENYGLLAAYGYSDTASDSEVIANTGRKESELILTNSYLQTGAFYYLFPGLRATAGVSFHSVSGEFNQTGEETEDIDDNFTGVFYSIGYSHRFSGIVLGAEYTQMIFDEYNQSGLFFMLGFLI
jgi:hypothetical protein